MENLAYLLSSIILSILLFISEILGTSQKTDSKSITMLTTNLVSTGREPENIV